eukprot:COSAG06_NODE_70056_length_194_cov_22.484211_1_plen_32_part_10
MQCGAFARWASSAARPFGLENEKPFTRWVAQP